MYCYNCGKEIAETVKFCPYCGAEQKQPQQPVQQPQQQEPQPQPIQQQPAQWQNPQQQDTQWQAPQQPTQWQNPPVADNSEKKQFLADQTSHHSGSRRPCGRSSACSARVP